MVIFLDDKCVRYITRILTLDKERYSTNWIAWKEHYDLEKFLSEEFIHYGLHLVSKNSEVFIRIEYTNMIWEYRIFYGSYKKKYKTLSQGDERWPKFEKDILDDLKIMGVEYFKDEILYHLKKQKYFEHKNKIDKQFKRYCI